MNEHAAGATDAVKRWGKMSVFEMLEHLKIGKILDCIWPAIGQILDSRRGMTAVRPQTKN